MVESDDNYYDHIDLANAHHNQAHATTHSNGGNDEVTLENLGSAGTADQLPVADGSGGMSMESIRKGEAVQGTNITASGLSDDVSTEMAGKTGGASAASGVGVVTVADENNCIFTDTNGDAILDGSGNRVYGRITLVGAVWTLTYYSGDDVAYSFAAPTTVVWYYQEISLLPNVPVLSGLFSVTSDQVAATIPDATTTLKGKVELATDGESAANVVVQGNDSRMSDSRDPTNHAANHTDGTDDIQDATDAQKGLATAAQITKLDGIAAGADVTANNAPQAHAASHTDGTDDIQNATDAQKGLATAAQITKLDGIAAGADVTADNAPQAHATSHTDGTDDIQDATDAQKGLATAAQITKLDGIEAGADVTDATNVAAAGAVMDSDFTAANEVMVGTAAGTHAQVTLAASQFLGRKAAGSVTNMTKADALGILNVADGADVTADNAPQAHAASHVTGGGDVIDDVVAGGNAGLMTGADKTKLNGVATGADVTADNAPQAHAASHSDGGADEITIENLATAGAADTVPTSDGAGGLTMQAASAGVDLESIWAQSG